MTGKEIIVKAIETYGVEAQIRQMMEELAELIVAEIEGEREGIVEELGDVVIMCMQMREIMGVKESKEKGKVNRGEVIKESAETIKKLNKWLRGQKEGADEQVGKLEEVIEREIEGRGIEREVEGKVREKLKRLKSRL